MRLLLLISLLNVLGCVQQEKSPAVEVAGKAPRKTEVATDSTYETGTKDGTASVPFILYQDRLRDLDLASDKLTYKFSFLITEKSGDLKFTNGKSELKIDKLTIGKPGQLTLEIRENGVLRLKGEIANLTLREGANQLKIEMKEVNPPPPGPGSTPRPSSTPGPTPTPSPSTGGSAVTYEQVRPMLQAKCIKCHGTGGDPDFSVVPFKSVFGLSQRDVVTSMVEMVDGARPAMPPAPEVSLTQPEVQLLKDWLNQGLR